MSLNWRSVLLRQPFISYLLSVICRGDIVGDQNAQINLNLRVDKGGGIRKTKAVDWGLGACGKQGGILIFLSLYPSKNTKIPRCWLDIEIEMEIGNCACV
jgi:hypothetical protein